VQVKVVCAGGSAEISVLNHLSPMALSTVLFLFIPKTIFHGLCNSIQNHISFWIKMQTVWKWCYLKEKYYSQCFHFNFWAHSTC